MELRHLRYFAAVAETRHFGRAAERLHIAQPALSQSVRQLETELGTPLFTRTTRQVNLTAAGEFLYGEATRVLGRGRGQCARRPAASPRAARPGPRSASPAPRRTPSYPGSPDCSSGAARRRGGDPRRPAHPCPGRRACVTAASTSGCCARRSPARSSSCGPSWWSACSWPCRPTTGWWTSRSSRPATCAPRSS